MQSENPLTDNSPMPFGQHKGKAMANVPAQYLLWLYNKGVAHGPVGRYILDNLEALKSEVKR